MSVLYYFIAESEFEKETLAFQLKHFNLPPDFFHNLHV